MWDIDIEKLPTFRMGFKRGLQEGEKRGVRLNIASRMLKMAMFDVEEIAELTDLTVDEVECLRVEACDREMNNQGEEADIPAEIDFSGGERGKLYHPDLQVSGGAVMRTINIAEAESRFSEIMEQVGAGQEILIEKSGVPFAKIVAISQEELPPRILGLGRGKLKIPDGFNTMEAEAIRAMFEGKNKE